jgi:hypothetical protein
MSVSSTRGKRDGTPPWTSRSCDTRPANGRGHMHKTCVYAGFAEPWPDFTSAQGKIPSGQMGIMDKDFGRVSHPGQICCASYVDGYDLILQ